MSELFLSYPQYINENIQELTFFLSIKDWHFETVETSTQPQQGQIYIYKINKKYIYIITQCVPLKVLKDTISALVSHLFKHFIKHLLSIYYLRPQNQSKHLSKYCPVGLHFLSSCLLPFIHSLKFSRYLGPMLNKLWVSYQHCPHADSTAQLQCDVGNGKSHPGTVNQC